MPKNITLLTVLCILMATASCRTTIPPPATLATAPIFSIYGVNSKEWKTKSGEKKAEALMSDLKMKYEEVFQKVIDAKKIAIYGQIDDVRYRKKIGLYGVLLNAAAITLNVASTANLVWVTGLNAASGAATAYVTTDNGMLDPLTNQNLQQAKNRIDEKLEGFHIEVEVLCKIDPSTEFPKWHSQYTKTLIALQRVELATTDITELPPRKKGWIDKGIGAVFGE